MSDSLTTDTLNCLVMMNIQSKYEVNLPINFWEVFQMNWKGIRQQATSILGLYLNLGHAPNNDIKTEPVHWVWIWSRETPQQNSHFASSWCPDLSPKSHRAFRRKLLVRKKSYGNFRPSSFNCKTLYKVVAVIWWLIRLPPFKIVLYVISSLKYTKLRKSVLQDYFCPKRRLKMWNKFKICVDRTDAGHMNIMSLCLLRERWHNKYVVYYCDRSYLCCSS